MSLKKIFLLAVILIAIPSFCFSSDFTDNGDGTITDNKTGLMWMKATADSEMTWKQALSYCENLDHAGYSDWRLPNIKELGSIVDYSIHDPAIDTNFFSIPAYTPLLLYYWSSTTYSVNTENAWLINFYSGHDSSHENISDSSFSKADINMYYVRAVRGGE